MKISKYFFGVKTRKNSISKTHGTKFKKLYIVLAE